MIVDLRAGVADAACAGSASSSRPRNGNALYVPAGFAHGFLTLRDETDVFYQMGEFYEAEAARGMRWNDPRVGIDWPVTPAMMSDRDRTYPDLDLAALERAAMNGRTRIDGMTRGRGRCLRWSTELYPICRSITGDGVRETLRVIGRQVPAPGRREVPSGTEVLDWTVPREWNMRDAYVADAGGNRVIDFRRSNLHVVNYSVPVRAADVARRAAAPPAHPPRLTPTGSRTARPTTKRRGASA